MAHLSEVGKESAHPAVGGRQMGQGDTRHRRGQGKGQLDEAVDKPLPRELIAHQDPGQDQAHDPIDDRRDDGGENTDIVAGQNPGPGDGGEKLRGCDLSRVNYQAGQGDKDDKAQDRHHNAEGKAKTRNDALFLFSSGHGHAPFQTPT